MLINRDETAPGVICITFGGEGMDCDTCGWSYDEGELYYFPDGKFYLETRYGCYGGAYNEDREGVLEELEHVARFMDADEEIEQIKELLKSDK